MNKPYNGMGFLTIEKHIELTQELETALLVLLDQIDYTSGRCKLNDTVAATVPVELIYKARTALANLLEF